MFLNDVVTKVALTTAVLLPSADGFHHGATIAASPCSCTRSTTRERSFDSRNNSGVEIARSASAASSDFTTALERLGQERGFSSLDWFDPAAEESTDETDFSDATAVDDLLRMPLYPLQACYLPGGSEHVLNNVRKRNVRMAQDLHRGAFDSANENGETSRMFCASLLASDTGRVACVGTVMEVVSLDPSPADRRRSDVDVDRDALLSDAPTADVGRVVVVCRPVQRVEIVRVENPRVWDREHRLRDADDYLVVRVRPLDDDESRNDDDAARESLSNDHAAVREFYRSGDDAAVGDLLPYAREALSCMPALDENDDDDDVSGCARWRAAEAWQSLCHTIREARIVGLRSDVDEIMVRAASEKGGPLNLPIHLEDLPAEVGRIVRRMEERAFDEYVETGLDPVLDFQQLLVCRDERERSRLLGEMINRERRRLEVKSRLINMRL